MKILLDKPDITLSSIIEEMAFLEYGYLRDVSFDKVSMIDDRCNLRDSHLNIIAKCYNKYRPAYSMASLYADSFYDYYAEQLSHHFVFIDSDNRTLSLSDIIIGGNDVFHCRYTPEWGQHMVVHHCVYYLRACRAILGDGNFKLCTPTISDYGNQI